MAHGYVTINIKYRPETEMNVNLEEKRERSNSEGGLTSIHEEHQPPLLKYQNNSFGKTTNIFSAI